MCKNPASECRPIEADDAQTGEDNVMSEDESEPTDSDESYVSESSVDYRADSDSDGESVSGNRVTPEMVLLLMLKEAGAISEEQYAAKAEKFEDNIKSLIPIIPRSVSLDTLDYTRDLEDSSDGNCDNGNDDEVLKAKLVQELVGETNNTVESENCIPTDINSTDAGTATDTSKHIKAIEKVSDVKVSGMTDTDLSLDGVSKAKCIGENTQLLEESITVNKYEFNEEDVNNLRQDAREEKKEQVTFENISTDNSEDKTVTGELNKGYADSFVLECNSTEQMVTKTENAETMLMEIDNKSLREFEEDGTSTTETKMENYLDESNVEIVANNNPSHDIVLSSKTDKESSKDQNTKNESNATGKKTKSFRYILNKLVREKRIPEEDEEDRISDEYGSTYAEVLRSYVKELDDYYGPDMTASKMSLSDDDDDYEEDGGLKQFAIFLNFYSPSSYKYVIETFNTPLPDHKVLCSWYLKDDEEPGLTERAFKILKQKSSEKRLTCSLMFIDIFLKNHGRYYDQVDYGGGQNDDYVDRAVFAYVFVLVSLDEDWKMPIGYIYVRNVPAETQAELIRVCLTQCHDAGADVVAVTLETLTPAEFLGCSFQDPKKLKTTFKHPVCDRDVAVWIDPCLLLKSARETLKVKRALIDDQGNRVRWSLISKLRRLQKDSWIAFEKPEFFELRNHIAKVGLTTEIFSKNLAPALELSEDLLPELFTDTEPTRLYILFINMVYSILNSRVTSRMQYVARHLKAAKRYLLRMYCNEENGLSPFDRINLAWGKQKKGFYRYFLRGEAACGFLGFLICIESFKHLYDTLIKKEKRITSLNPQRLCKVQAENFVTTLRAHSCWDPEYFSGSQFQGYYKQLFDVIEKNPQFTDRKVSLEQWPLTNRYPPAVTIKLTSGKRCYDDIYSSQYMLKRLRKTSDESRATKIVREYSRALDVEKVLSTRKNMVGYIAGWIAAKFAKCLRCEVCIDALCTHKKLWFHKFLTLRRIYAVCLPSEELFKICWECERALRIKRTPLSIKAWVLRRLASKFPWSSRVSKHPPGHHIQLARAVIAKYVAVRIPAPFSCKQRTKIIKMFRRFTSKDGSDSYDELAEWMESSSEEDDEQLC